MCTDYALYIAEIDEVDAVCSTEEPGARWPTLCLDKIGITPLELFPGRLDSSGHEGRNCRKQVLIRVSPEGNVVLRMWSELVTSLAQIAEEVADEVAARWESSLLAWDNECNPYFGKSSIEPTSGKATLLDLRGRSAWPSRSMLVDAVNKLSAFAQQAVKERKAIFWRLSPTAWSERLMFEQDCNAVLLGVDGGGCCWRIPYGEESASTHDSVPHVCPDCYTPLGWFHLAGCPREQ